MKKVFAFVLALIMVFAVASCGFGNSFAEYKEAAKATIETYAQKRKNTFCEDGWATVCAIVADGKTTVDDATSRYAVDETVKTVKKEIRKVETKTTFPSVLEEFDIKEFTDEFFDDYTLILVPLWRPSLAYERLFFYTAFVENGKLNFLLENSSTCGDDAEDWRTFAVIVRKTVLEQNEIGELRVFDTYDLSDYDGGETLPERSREELQDIEANSVEHRVSYVSNKHGELVDNPTAFKRGVSVITAISSTENLKEYFDI